MGVLHYSAFELAALFQGGMPGFLVHEHVQACERCGILLALVRRAQGEPTAEQAEVLVNSLTGSGVRQS
jgi:hypothetical protein